MANILISYYSDYGEAMYDAITNILQGNGNNIFRFNINNPSVDITTWGGKSTIVDLEILNKIKTFNPEIVLNFNNCLPVNAYQVLNKECKICLIDADAPEIAFWNKDMIKPHLKQILFLGLQSYSKTMYERYLKMNLTDKNYLYFPPGTVIRNEKLKQDKNISFIGSNFYPLSVPHDEDFYSGGALKVYDALVKDYFLTFENAKKIFPACSKNLFVNIRAYYCGQERLKYMQQLTDLGFTFYGVRWWNHIAYIDFDLAKCFDQTPKISVEDNQWVYNTSKVSVNISHPLAKSSFSWRVMDIMASNACLVMEDKPDWRNLFGKYLSKETINSIIYKDRFDMRDKVKRLLSDETLRQKCVKELNNAIEQNGRWEIRFKSLEKFLGIKLLNLNQKGKLIRIERKENFKKKKNFLANFKLKNRIKVFTYGGLLVLSQIPIIDICLNRKKRVKLLEKINKYWR